MRFIKKVSQTPIQSSGFIVDSLNTSDNKRVNAPSLRVVKEGLKALDSKIEGKLDNLIFNADFTMTNNTAFGINKAGWIHNENRMSPLPSKSNGGLGWTVNSTVDDYIISPNIFPEWMNRHDTDSTYHWDFNEFFPITVSIEFFFWSTSQSSSDEFEIKTASATFASRTDSAKVLTNVQENVDFTVELTTDGRLKFGLTGTNTTNRIFVRAIKAEYGETASPIIHSQRDAEMLRLAEEIARPVGIIITTTSNSSPSASSEMNLAGTWTRLGSITVGSSTVYFWQRTE